MNKRTDTSQNVPTIGPVPQNPPPYKPKDPPSPPLKEKK